MCHERLTAVTLGNLADAAVVQVASGLPCISISIFQSLTLNQWDFFNGMCKVSPQNISVKFLVKMNSMQSAHRCHLHWGSWGGFCSHQLITLSYVKNVLKHSMHRRIWTNTWENVFLSNSTCSWNWLLLIMVQSFIPGTVHYKTL